MAKDKGPRRPRAETPKGFRDYFGAEVTARAAMLTQITEVYHRYGFDALETSAVETVEALGKFLPDVDRPNEGVFAWQDEDESWMALRYDMTAPLARVYAQKRAELPTPYRRYAMGPVWRNEKPGPGRFRQFYQCDADTVGAASVAADAEICAMLSDVFETLGLGGQYVIKINNRKVLNGVMEVAGLSGDDKAAERGIVLRAIDKFDRLGPTGVLALLREGRKDESGDFTKGAGLDAAQAGVVMRFVNATTAIHDRMIAGFFGPSNPLPDDAALGATPMEVLFPDLLQIAVNHPGELRDETLAYLTEVIGSSEIGRQGVEELRQIADLLLAQGYGPDRIRIDPSVVRGLGYYTGPVFEAELTFEVTDEKGRPRQFGSVAGGGRYDDLVKRFTGETVPATGISIGVDRLLAALAAKAKNEGRGAEQAAGPVVVTVMDRDRMADYMKMVGMLRGADIRAEVYLGNPKNFGNQMKYADKRGAPLAIIAGSDEFAKGVVQIKDLVLGKVIAANASLEEWKDRPAQEEVLLSDLVEFVKRKLRAYSDSDQSEDARYNRTSSTDISELFL